MQSATPAMSSKHRGLEGLRALFINRSYALLWGGQAISVIGDFASATTLILWVTTLIARGQAWAPLAVSGVLGATIAPEFIIAPLAGVLADRWNRRRTMLAMDATRAILIALLVPATGLVSLPFLPDQHLPLAWQLGIIYAMVFLVSACTQLFNPSMLALIGVIVPEPYRARASGLRQTASSVAAILGPSIAALIFFTVGIQWALLLNALSFGVSFLAILAIRAPITIQAEAAGPSEGVLREFRAGLRFYFGNRVLVTLLVTSALTLLGFGTLNTLDIFFLTQNLRAAPSVYGLLNSAQGVGLIGGAIFAAAFARRIGEARVLGLSLLAWGAITLVYARLNSVPPAIALLCLTGFMLSTAQVAETPLLLRVTPQRLLGRVYAVLVPAMSAAELIGIGLSGYLASTVLRSFHSTLVGIAIGPVDTIFTVIGLCIFAAGIFAAGIYATVQLRGVRLTSEEAHLAEQLEMEPMAK